jgi:hypothetical protein
MLLKNGSGTASPGLASNRQEASMKAIAGISAKHMALLDEYRMALSLWSETRAVYTPEAAEVVEATRRLEELEQELSLCVPVATGNSIESSNAIGLLPPAS